MELKLLDLIVLPVDDLGLVVDLVGDHHKDQQLGLPREEELLGPLLMEPRAVPERPLLWLLVQFVDNLQPWQFGYGELSAHLVLVGHSDPVESHW